MCPSPSPQQAMSDMGIPLLPPEPIQCSGRCGRQIVVPLMDIGVVVPVINGKDGWKMWVESAFCPYCYSAAYTGLREDHDKWLSRREAMIAAWDAENPKPTSANRGWLPWRLTK